MEDLFPRRLIRDGAEVDDHICPFEQRVNGLPIPDIAFDVTLVRRQIVNAVRQISGDQRVAHLRQRLPANVAQTAGGTGQNDLHVWSFPVR